jgi:hypothetical protein
MEKIEREVAREVKAMGRREVTTKRDRTDRLQQPYQALTFATRHAGTFKEGTTPAWYPTDAATNR